MEKELVHGIDHDEKVARADSIVDTSRPFRSVKEAVAIFGERFLAGEICSPKPFTLPQKEVQFFSPSPRWKEVLWKQSSGNSDTVKKLEAELEETKAELKLLKERESEKEVALATLAQDEVATSFGNGEMVVMKEKKKRDGFIRMKNSNSTSLAEILSMGDLFVKSKKESKLKKKKPIIPLVGDLFSRKKRSSTSLHNSFYASPMQWN